MNDPLPPPPLAAKPRTSTGAKWAMGCGAGCLVIIMLLGVGIFFGVKVLHQKVQQYAVEFEEQGYTKEMGQMIEVTTTPTIRTLYMGQLVKIMVPCEDDIAIVAQAAEVFGRVNGDVHFKGQTITIQPKAHIKGDLDVSAQAVVVYGKIDGEIKGLYQFLDDKRE